MPTGLGLRPGAKAPDEPPTPYRLRASPRLYTNVVGTLLTERRLSDTEGPLPSAASAASSRLFRARIQDHPAATTRRRSTPAGCPASPSRSAHPHPAPTAHPLAYPSPSMPTQAVPSASLPAPRGLTQRLIVGDRVEYANGVARTAVRRPLDSDDPAAGTCGRDFSRMSPSRRSHRHIGPRTAERVRYNPIMDCAGNCTRPLDRLHKYMQRKRLQFHGSVRCESH